MTTVLYARVSTTEQTIDHQAIQAQQAGFVIDKIVADHGQSGIQTKLRDRPEGRRLFDILRGGDTLVVRWIDRLGRNYADVCDVMRELLSKGITIKTVINRMTFDGTTTEPTQMAVRDAMIAFMAAMAQAQAEATKEAQRAGIEHAKTVGQADKYRGRKPSYDRSQLALVVDLLHKGDGVSAIAKETGLSRQTIMRIRDTPDQAEAALQAWDL